MSRTARTAAKSAGLLIFAYLIFSSGSALAQNSKTMGEVHFKPATKVERHSGVWIDGQYVGYMNELKWVNRVRLIPGSHEISVRQVGFTDVTQNVTIEPGVILTFAVRMAPNVKAQYPGADAAKVKLDVRPKRAAVFLDDGYVGNAGHFGGVNTMLVSPGNHRIRVELQGYHPFETDINLIPGQTSKVETNLVAGAVEQVGALNKTQ